MEMPGIVYCPAVLPGKKNPSSTGQRPSSQPLSISNFYKAALNLITSIPNKRNSSDSK